MTRTMQRKEGGSVKSTLRKRRGRDKRRLVIDKRGDAKGKATKKGRNMNVKLR